jgi:hypothetical protein
MEADGLAAVPTEQAQPALPEAVLGATVPPVARVVTPPEPTAIVPARPPVLVPVPPEAH